MSSLIRRRSGRGLAVRGSAIAVALAIIGVAPPANASPPTAAPPAAPAATTSAAPAAPVLATTVTLLTGHVVEYQEDAGGRRAATVLSSPPGSETIQSFTDDTGVYVLPDSAEPLIATGVLDRGLFDVQYLARNGYADDQVKATPLIVSYGAGASAQARSAAATLPGATKRQDLHSISGAGVTIDKARSGEFWSALTRNAAAAGPAASASRMLGAGITKVWLDRKVQVTLSESVPLIGAPEAWAAGYDGTGVKVAILDTGIDATHPDLQGKVVESKSFVPGQEVADGHGHGTHVASTIAGSGAGSNGSRKGVAPGAELMIGKVLSNTGSGPTSGVIDGMEWAATNGADIISMSLGSGPTDGTDPSSQAVNRLTAETGTLFVIAAGNVGKKYSVGAPGAADAALTVAATDKSDGLASFSSRGPRVEDHALKPDIAAPGVGIVAARAAGTSMGTPVDDLYTSANGTSMATPHVAGAAAVLAQQHPDWTAAQLKSTLMSTSQDAGHTVYEQGAGRLDIARAVRQQVTTTTVNVDFGAVSPNTDPTLDKTVRYANPTDQPVTLTLTPKLREVGGDDVSSTLTTSAGTVTVPAGGSTEITVSVDAAALDNGTYTGSVVATTDTGTRITVPVGLVRKPPSREITVRITGRPGEPLRSSTTAPIRCTFLGLDEENAGAGETVELPPVGSNVIEGKIRLQEGAYHFGCSGVFWSAKGSLRGSAFLQEPQYQVTGDATISYDLSTDLIPIPEIKTSKPSEGVQYSVGSQYTTSAGVAYSSQFLSATGSAYGRRLFTAPSKTTATIGDFKFYYEQLRTAPEATTTVHGNGKVTLHPKYLNDDETLYYDPKPGPLPRVPKFETDQRLRLATTEDLAAGKDVRGKLVVLQTGPGLYSAEYQPVIDQAAAAGAAGILHHITGFDDRYHHGRIPPAGPWLDLKLPFLWVDGEQWEQIADVIDGAKNPYLEIAAQITSPYAYKLRPYYYDQKIPSTLVTKYDDRQLLRIDSEQHSQFPASPDRPNMSEVNYTWGPKDNAAIGQSHYYRVPLNRTEYYNVTGPQVTWDRRYRQWNPDDNTYRTIDTGFTGIFEPGRRAEKLTQAPFVVGQPDYGYALDERLAGFCVMCRQGDTFFITQSSVAAANPHVLAGDPLRKAFEVSLYRDGVKLPSQSLGTYHQFTLPPEEAAYQLKTVAYNNFSGQRLAQRVATDWTFHSRQATTGSVKVPIICLSEYAGFAKGPCDWQPLIQLSHDFDLALDDTTKAGRAYRFTVTPRQLVPNAPRIVGVKTQVSYNDGKTWTPALVIPWFNGTWQVLIKHPKLEHTTGAVSVRTEAWDSAGNRVVQQIDRAYGLTESHPLATP